MVRILTDFPPPLPDLPRSSSSRLQQAVRGPNHRPLPLALMAACVKAASAPAAVCDHGADAARPTRKRKRIAMGSTDDYEETCCLGMGAFGSVHKARHRGTGRTVAIKRLVDAADVGSQVALLREASLHEASASDSPFVVGFHGLARSPATMDLCLVMECVGPSLGDVFHRRRNDGMPPLPEETVRAVMWQLLSGAKKMHDAHVIHRDIKPDNILVADDRTTVKICDFGLAMSMADPPPYGTAGSLHYMAPEVLLGKPDYDALVDAWSLGCVMAELIDGSPLFVASNEAEQLDLIFHVRGVPDETTWPWFSSTQFAAQSQLTPQLKKKRRNLLREEFPKKKLSLQGFKVLSGLLTCNPDKRLTAAAALKHPWFTKMNAPELHLQKKEVPSALPKIKRLRVLCP